MRFKLRLGDRDFIIRRWFVSSVLLPLISPLQLDNFKTQAINAYSEGKLLKQAI